MCSNSLFLYFGASKKLLAKMLEALILLAERVGFEPTVPLTGHLISSQAPSTTRTPLQKYSVKNI